ncbi:hypothetical protein M422DRAFT_274993, partial [Sphaerobolus stellatus SS14]
MEPPAPPTYSLFQAAHQDESPVKIGTTRPAASPLKRDAPSVQRRLDKRHGDGRAALAYSPSPHRELFHQTLGWTNTPEPDEQPKVDKGKKKETCMHAPVPKPVPAPSAPQL